MQKKKKRKYKPPPTKGQIQRWKETQEKDLRKNIKKLVSSIVRNSESEYADVWRKLKGQFNGESVTTASIQGLIEREKVLTKWEDELITEFAQQDLYRLKDELSEREDDEDDEDDEDC